MKIEARRYRGREHRHELSRALLRRGSFLVVMGLVTAILLCSPAVLAQGDHVDVISVKGVIDPITAQYVSRGIEIAQSDGAQCLVIQLDTPGGSDGPMRAIVQDLLSSPVPIVVFVAPAGARAASAGVFITLAANLAAMAPGTNIGAAHPVALTGVLTGTIAEKATNDAAAYARAIAERRGRNADWAERAVRESISNTAREAMEAHVIDLVAEDLPDLLAKIDGRTVSTIAGEQVLATKGIEPRRIEMSLPQKILHAIVDPNIAYLLLTIGIWALVAEFYHPGAIVPGVTGVICLILAFVAFGSLPVNWGGVVLIFLAVFLFILDIKVAGYALSVGGAVAFVLGSLFLFSPLTPSSPAMPRLVVSRPLIAVMTAAIAAFFLFALSAGIRAQRAELVSGIGTMVGATGVATSDLDPLGTVQAESELWSAVADGGKIICKGKQVKVVAVEGVRLRVRVDDADAPDSSEDVH